MTERDEQLNRPDESESDQPKVRKVRLNLDPETDRVQPAVVEPQPEIGAAPRLEPKRMPAAAAPPSVRTPAVQAEPKTNAVAANGTKRTVPNVARKTSGGSRRTTQSTLRDVFATGLSKEGQLTLDDQKRLGARVFRVKGYTTQAKIRRKFNQNKQQRFLRNLLTLILLVVVVAILIIIYNPIRDIIDVRKMLGMDSPFQSIPTLPPTEPTIGIP